MTSLRLQPNVAAFADLGVAGVEPQGPNTVRALSVQRKGIRQHCPNQTVSRFGSRFHQSAQVNLLPFQRKDAKTQRLEMVADVVSCGRLLPSSEVLDQIGCLLSCEACHLPFRH